MRAFEVHVKEAPSEPVASSNQDPATAALTKSLRETFPECVVIIEQTADMLIVSGQCKSDKEATKIIRMVRKNCLMPVRDNLVVR